jgi:CysZ protein
VALVVAVRLAFWEGATWIEGFLIQMDLGIFPDPTEHAHLPQPILDLQQSAFDFISFIGATILFAVFTLLGLLVAIFFSAPAMHAMASRVECTLDGTPVSDLPPIAWVEPMQRSGMGLVSWILGQVVFLPLQLFPIFGGMLETTMGLGWSSLVMGRELVDGALSARGLTFPQQVRLVWSQRTTCGALGLLGSLTLWIPLVNVVAFPALVTGATLWVRDLSEEELDPQPESEPPDPTPELD